MGEDQGEGRGCCRRQVTLNENLHPSPLPTREEATYAHSGRLSQSPYSGLPKANKLRTASLTRARWYPLLQRLGTQATRLPRDGFNAANLPLQEVSLSRMRCYLSLKTPPIMKKRLRHRFRFIGILFAFAVAIGPTTFAIVPEKKEARVTQSIHDVQLLAPNAAPRPASVNNNVHPGTAVRTASDSRAELTFTDLTLARLGANSVFSFGEREFDLASGSILLYLPKSSGGARINTAIATSAGTSFTAMAEYHPKSWIKFIILEGHGSVSLKHHPGETRALHAGQMIMVRAGAAKLPEPQDVDLSELIKTSMLIAKFPPLPNLNLILREAENQQISPPSSYMIDPTGLNTRDQRAAALPSATPRTVPGRPPRP